MTKLHGEFARHEPQDPEYAIELNDSKGDKYVIGLRQPVRGCGLGSFVNRESREPGYKRKNCAFLQMGKKLYVEMIKDVPADDELYTIYGKGYRLK